MTNGSNEDPPVGRLMEPGDMRHLARRFWNPPPAAVAGRVYRVVTCETSEHVAPHLVQLGGSAAVIWYGQMRYLPAPELRVDQVRHPETGKLGNKLSVKNGGWTVTPEQVMLLLLTPVRPDDPNGEAAIEDELDSLAGLFSAVIATNTTYELVCEQHVDMTSTQMSSAHGYSRSVLTAVPDLGAARLLDVEDVVARLDRLDDDDRRRVRLSLTWFQRSLGPSDAGSYLSLWLALETLAMPGTTNLRPIKERLASVYGLDVQAVDSEFGIGRLYGVRSKIVHGGDTARSLFAPYLRRLGAVYVDVLRSTLGLAPVFALRNLEVSDSESGSD